jgi:hypothetical protein
MKLAMDNKKKQYIYIAIIVACFGGTIWVWFGGGISFGGSGESNISLSAPTSGSDNAILPYGTKFDTSILSDRRFKDLKDSDKLIITPEELGRPNPFLTNTSTPSQ